jgi:adenylate cyclase
MKIDNFFAELKRRNVYKVAVAYAVVGWLVIQVSSTVLPTFHAPEWVVQTLMVLVALGFPIALVLAWAFELTPEGLQRTDDVGRATEKRGKSHAWIYVVIVGALLSVGLFFVGRYTARDHIPTSGLQEKSIAVLPFENQNGDPDTDYLCDGIPESIINSLSELPKLKVMSRNSVFHYKGKETDAQTVGKELKVQTLLTGRVRQRADTLSIGVELINTQDNSQMWGQQYNRKLADVFAVQEEIAKEVSEKLRLKLTAAERQQLAKRPTENLKAFQYYMQGRSYTQRRTREDLLEAIRYCEKALEEDRNYALAYAGLSDAYANLGYAATSGPVKGGAKRKRLRIKPSSSMLTWPKLTSHLVKPTTISSHTISRPLIVNSGVRLKSARAWQRLMRTGEFRSCNRGVSIKAWLNFRKLANWTRSLQSTHG